MKSVLIPSETCEVAEISLSYHPKVKASKRSQINSSQETYQLLLKNWNTGKLQFVEQFKIILLSNANRVLGIYEVSSGGITATVVDIRLIFSAALLAHATRIILAHNHPSGSLKPSQADLRITQRLKDAGALLDIQVLEHLILSSEGYYSFADEGLL